MTRDADAISEESFVNCRDRSFDPHRPQQVFKRVFAYREEQPVAFIMRGCGRHRFQAGERVFLEGVFVHRTISGETVRPIATMWNVAVETLQVANTGLNNLGSYSRDQELAAGMTVLIPYDRRAQSVLFHRSEST